LHRGVGRLAARADGRAPPDDAGGGRVRVAYRRFAIVVEGPGDVGDVAADRAARRMRDQLGTPLDRPAAKGNRLHDLALAAAPVPAAALDRGHRAPPFSAPTERADAAAVSVTAPGVRSRSSVASRRRARNSSSLMLERFSPNASAISWCEEPCA